MKSSSNNDDDDDIAGTTSAAAAVPSSFPNVEKTPVLLLRFAPSACSRSIELVRERLEEADMIVLQSTVRKQDDDDNGEEDEAATAAKKTTSTVMSVTVSQSTLERHAQSIRIMKYMPEHRCFEHFTVQERDRFLDPPPSKGGVTAAAAAAAESGADNKKKQKQQQQSSSQPKYGGLFTSSECALIVSRMFERITVLPAGKKSTELSELLESKYCVVQRNEDDADADDDKKKKHHCRIFLRHVLVTSGIVDVVAPAHVPAFRNRVFREVFAPWYSVALPVNEMQDYYGWESAFYFAWMNFLTVWLVFPAVVGIGVVALRWYREDDIDTDEYTPFYGCLTFLWGILFLRFWDRHENRLAYRWGTYSLSPYERQKFFAARLQFRGYRRTSPVTGQEETYYPAVRRRFHYAVSAAVTVAMLSVAFTVMILSLNLQGYIRPESNPDRWNDNHPHPFHFPRLAGLSEEGQIFDSKHSWRCFIPVILHVICINVLNSMYRRVAETLTDRENHETEMNHRNSLVLKRFLFEAFDCYVALFYLAFYERDVQRLNVELIAIFQLDTVRRLFMECIIPLALQRCDKMFQKGVTNSSSNRSNNRSSSKNDDDKDVRSSAMRSLRETFNDDEDVLLDVEKEVLDHFDDYIEIVIQLGYVTLFASAYPLASVISILSIWIETRSDCLQMSFLYQRPTPYRSSGLGMWKNMMEAVIWTSALTNCLIAGFTSKQLTYYMPSIYVGGGGGGGGGEGTADDGDGDGGGGGVLEMSHERGWLVVFSIFGLERMLLLTGIFVFLIIPAVPEDVSEGLERRHYLHLLEEEELARIRRREKTD